MAAPTTEAQICTVIECFKSTTDLCNRWKTVYYCSDSYQVVHCPEHKQACYEAANLDRTIQRAGSLLQDTLYLFGEKTFASKFVEVTRNGGRLRVTLDTTRVFQTFPHDMVQSNQEKHMLLSLMTGRVTFGIFHDILCELLKNTPVQIEELMVYLKHPQFYAEGTFIAKLELLVLSTTQGRYRSFGKHNVFRIKAKNSCQSWFLDTFGAKYGIFSGCIDSQTYLESFRNRINVIAPGGTWRKLYDKLSELPREGTVTNRIQLDATREVIQAMKVFEKEAAIGIPDLLPSSDDAYPARRARLLELISTSLEKFVANADYENDFSAIKSRDLAEGIERTRIFTSVMGDHERFVKKFEV